MIFSIALFFAFTLPSAAGPADGFAATFAQFQAAVKTGDKNKVADLTDFSDFFWDSDDSLRNVKTRADFLKNYDRMFTPDVKKRIATIKPSQDKTGSYHVAWQKDEMDYDLFFPPRKDGKWLLQGLAAAPL